MNTSTSVGRSFRDSDDSSRPPYRDSGRKFNLDYLPADLRRVYDRLEDMFGEEYALTVVFVIRTAVELHRAWHMSLMTANVLQQLKERFNLRMTWTLGVIELNFRIEDGLYELHRRVPFDYDSEFQNMYFKTAVALVEGNIGVHDALIFQKELLKGKHTCPSGQFLRSNPGRLLLYPLQAATCSIIFFHGNLRDAGASAVCGITAGLIEWALSSKRFFSNTNESKTLIDCLVGLSTGIIGGLFYRSASNGDEYCLRAVFLGTLYWFFYGTAFVVGLLEIIAGKLQTGVTRFLAVAVKTFVLSVGSAAGLTIVLGGDVYDLWVEQLNPQDGTCDNFELGSKYPWDPWWRIPLYLLCSVSVLGQYRFIIMNYWAGLLVQLAAYVAQETVKKSLGERHKNDGMDTVCGDVVGAMSAVVTASFIALVVDWVKYESKIAVTDGNYGDHKLTTGRKLTKNTYQVLVRVGNCLGLGRGLTKRFSLVQATIEEESRKQDIPKSEIKLEEEEESTLVEAAVEAQEFNVWSLLMPAVYQLVPGSKLAMYWYNVIFPPQPFEDGTVVFVNETDDFTEQVWDVEFNSRGATKAADSAEYALWLTSVSLALGLVLGLFVVRIIASVTLTVLSPFRNISNSEDEDMLLRQRRRQEMTFEAVDEDPDDASDGSSLAPQTKQGEGLRNRKKNGTSVTGNGSKLIKN